MSLTYAGVALPLTTPEHLSWLESVHPPNFNDWEAWNFEGFGLEHLPTPPLPVEPPFTFGKLYWPTGACCPAWFHAVVNTAKLNEIRDAVGDRLVAKPLVLSDGRDGKTVTAQMFMLPARPLNVLGVTNTDGWILTLTDARFFWHWKRGVIRTKPASWEALFISLGNMLGLSIDTDLIESSYGSPTKKWVGYFRPTATVLDAAAAQIGHRVVVDLDGNVRTVRWQTAKGESDAYLLAEDAAHVVSGGFLDHGDVGRYVPEALLVMFASGVVCSGAGFGPDCASGLALGPEPYLQSRYLATLAGSGYGSTYGTAISEVYGDASGLANASGQFYADFVFDETNAEACAALATSAASDWYGWRAADTDLVFPGIEPWVPTGWEDYAEWTYQKREDQPFASTLVRRGPWDQFVSGSWNSGLEKCPCPDDGGNGFHARLTTTDLNASGTDGWNFYKLKLQAGAFVDDGPEVEDWVAIPCTNATTQGQGATGLRVWMWPSQSQPGYYEFVPVSDQIGFHARLTTSGTNGEGTTGWNFFKLKLENGAFVDDGAEVEDFQAIGLTINGVTQCNPVATLRVWMFPSATLPGYYEFLPLGMRVEELDENPSYTPIHTWRFGTGFVVGNPEDGVARIDFIPPPASAVIPYFGDINVGDHTITANDDWQRLYPPFPGVGFSMPTNGIYHLIFYTQTVGQVSNFGASLGAEIRIRLYDIDSSAVLFEESALFIDNDFTTSVWENNFTYPLLLYGSGRFEFQALRTSVTTWGDARTENAKFTYFSLNPTP